MNPVHPHAMILWSADRPYECSSCKEPGFQRFYHCAHCNLHFHEGCASAPPFAVHPLHKNCILDYRKTTTLFRSCDACGTSIAGARYRHKDGGLLSAAASVNLHPRCVGLPAAISGDGVQLHLVGREWSKTLAGLNCQICSRRSFSGRGGGGGRRWSYVSACGELGFHVACVKELIREGIMKNGRGCFLYGPSSSLSGAAAEAVPASPLTRMGQRTGEQLASKFMVKIGLKIVLSAVLGDPSMIIGSFIVDLIPI